MFISFLFSWVRAGLYKVKNIYQFIRAGACNNLQKGVNRLLYVGFVALIACIFAFAESEDELNGKAAVGIAISTLLLLVISAFGIGIICTDMDTYEAVGNTQEIVSLQDNSQVSGRGRRFYVSIDTNNIYTYYYQLENGGYKQGQVSADKTVIYEEENCEKPVVQEYVTYKRHTTLTSILLFSGEQDKQVDSRYEIHVPTGTILQEFNLDAET